MLHIRVDIEPMGIQSVRSTRAGHHYQPKKNKRYKAEIARQIKAQLPRGWKPIDTYVKLANVKFVFPARKQDKKNIATAINSHTELLKNTKPDLQDNLFKGLCDAAEGLLWTNDSRIAIIESATKTYGQPSIQFEVVEVDKFGREI